MWPWWDGRMYRIVTGVTSDVGVPSTYLVCYKSVQPCCACFQLNLSRIGDLVNLTTAKMSETKANGTWNVSMELTLRFKHYPLVMPKQIYQHTPPVMQGFMGMFSAWFHSRSVLSKTYKIYHRKRPCVYSAGARAVSVSLKIQSIFLLKSLQNIPQTKTTCQFFWCQNIKCEFKNPHVYFVQFSTDNNRTECMFSINI